MGLFGMMARTAVVAGTATAVSNRVSRRQATKWQQQADAQAYEEQPQQQAPPQYQPPPPPPPAPEPAAADSSSLVDELQKLASLKEQGILSEDEFTAAKNKLLGP
ncbi:MAG TPA: SHOCT domain-containing protein [Nakamurella sp.]|nr:SHOCT domain-containing protein [Nakamurella sp.]